MAGTIKRDMPSVEMLQNLVPKGTAGASNAVVVGHPMMVKVPMSTTGGTANAGYVSWINPESGTILVPWVAVYFRDATATGTGTFDMGVSADGTGSNDNIFDGGTMSGLATVLVSKRGRTGTEGGGTKGVAEGFVLGPGGSGTNNSIVAKTSETATTAIGFLFIEYFVVS